MDESKITQCAKRCAVGMCPGEIDFRKEIPIGDSLAYPCNQCGRLHWASGAGVRRGKSRLRAFFKDGVVNSGGGVD